MSRAPTALIAEDEPLLAAALQSELKKAWPRLEVVAVVGNGPAAVQQALSLVPDVLFLDIRMPGQTGLDAAAELAELWPEGTAFPALVFVTAYDQYAVQAFEAQAVDYLLKPVLPERLARTIQRLQERLAQRLPVPQQLDQALDQLRQLLATDTKASGPAEPLSVIQASVGNSIRLVPLGEVLVFEAADKYLRVLTAAARVPDPHRAARTAAAAGPGRVLADPPRHGGARLGHRQREPRRGRQAHRCACASAMKACRSADSTHSAFAPCEHLTQSRPRPPRRPSPSQRLS